MKEKVFGVVTIKYDQVTNSPSLAIKEVYEGEILRDVRNSSVEYNWKLCEMDPGEYYEDWNRIIFRIC